MMSAGAEWGYGDSVFSPMVSALKLDLSQSDLRPPQDAHAACSPTPSSARTVSGPMTTSGGCRYSGSDEFTSEDRAYFVGRASGSALTTRYRLCFVVYGDHMNIDKHHTIGPDKPSGDRERVDQEWSPTTVKEISKEEVRPRDEPEPDIEESAEDPSKD